MRVKRTVVAVTLAAFAAGLWVSDPANAKKKGQLVPSGFLGDYSNLEPHPDKKDLLVYRKSEGVLKGYREFILDQPLVYFHAEAKNEGIDPNDLKMLS